MIELGSPHSAAVRYALYDDESFRSLFDVRGRPAESPWRLALVTGMQGAEGLSDRQAAEAVRARLDWKHALGLELTDPGFNFAVLSEFRNRLLGGSAEQHLLDALLTACKARGCLRARGQQRTDSTHVLVAFRVLNRLEQVAETPRAALNAVAADAPAWLRTIAPPDWFGRYGRRIEEYRLPRGNEARQRQQTAEFAARYAPRAGIEGTLSQGIRAFGRRKARYRGLAKTHVSTSPPRPPSTSSASPTG